MGWGARGFVRHQGDGWRNGLQKNALATEQDKKRPRELRQRLRWRKPWGHDEAGPTIRKVTSSCPCLCPLLLLSPLPVL